jgi:hypothetical protein
MTMRMIMVRATMQSNTVRRFNKRQQQVKLTSGQVKDYTFGIDARLE